MDLNWHDIWRLSLMALLTLRPGFLRGPLEKYEEAFHLSWAEALFHGKRPHADYYINYGPLYTRHFHLLQRLLGHSLRTHRLAMGVGNYLSLLAAYLCGALVTDSPEARLTMALTLPFLCLDQRYLTCWGGFRMGAGLCFALAFSLALRGGQPWAFFGCGLLASGVALFSLDEGFSAVASTLPVLTLGALLPGDAMPDLLPTISNLAAGGAAGATLGLLWLASHGALQGYYQDLVQGTLRLNTWRGGTVYAPMPLKGCSGLSQVIKRLMSEDGFFYWAMLFTLLCVVLAALRLPELALSDPRRALPMLTLLCFGLAHLLSSWRLAVGPQFKTYLPAFCVLGCALAFDSAPAGQSGTLASLMAILAASSGNAAYLIQHYHAVREGMPPMKRYSGVLMPEPMTDMLERLEQAVRRHAQGRPTLFLPYDSSMSFFAQVPFYSRNSILVGEDLAPGGYQRLLKRLRDAPPSLVVEETGAPDLLPNLRTRERLKEVYELLERDYHNVEVIEPRREPRAFRDKVIALWPGAWFWFDEKNDFAMRPVALKVRNN